MADWRDCKLGEVVNLKRGYDLPHNDRIPGPFPIVSSSGITDHHAEAKVKGPGVITGRYGTLGEVFFVEEDFWPLNTSLYVQDFKDNDPRFISYLLRQLNFGTRNAAGAVPGVNRNHLHVIDVRVPPLPVQRRIAGILSAYDELIENNQRRIRILEERNVNGTAFGVSTANPVDAMVFGSGCITCACERRLGRTHDQSTSPC